MKAAALLDSLYPGYAAGLTWPAHPATDAAGQIDARGGPSVEIGDDAAVLAGGVIGLCHVSSPYGWRLMRIAHDEGNALKDQADCERIETSPRNAVECVKLTATVYLPHE